MTWTNRCLLVPAAQRVFAQTLCKAAVGLSGDGMWLAGASPTGNTPATWYVAEGLIQSQFAALLPLWLPSQDSITLIWTTAQTSMGDAATVTSMATTGGMTVTLLQVQALFAAVDVTQQDVWTALDRLSLKRIAGVA
jgi:hypothetical protein